MGSQGAELRYHKGSVGDRRLGYCAVYGLSGLQVPGATRASVCTFGLGLGGRSCDTTRGLAFLFLLFCQTLGISHRFCNIGVAVTGAVRVDAKPGRDRSVLTTDFAGSLGRFRWGVFGRGLVKCDQFPSRPKLGTGQGLVPWPRPVI